VCRPAGALGRVRRRLLAAAAGLSLAAPCALLPVEGGRHMFAGLPAGEVTGPVLTFLRTVFG
jgi:hypothetical protein